MALQTYSILYLNLVCEMIYIVAERLKTQKIQMDKSKIGTHHCTIVIAVNYFIH